VNSKVTEEWGILSSEFDAVGRLRVFLARNESEKDALDWIELGGVDKRIGADVEIGDDQYCVEEVSVKRERVVNVDNEIEHLRGRPGDGEQRADEKHRLDDVGLSPVLRVVLCGVLDPQVLGWQHLRRSTHCGEIVPSPELRTNRMTFRGLDEAGLNFV